MFVIRTKERDNLQKYLSEKNIQTGVHYPIALPKLKAYKYLNQDNEAMNANKNDQMLLSLPIGEHLDLKDVEVVIDSIKNFYK